MLLLLLLIGATSGLAEVREHPGSGEPLPYDRYIRTVSESDSPWNRFI
jgi:hypothetical protein